MGSLAGAVQLQEWNVADRRYLQRDEKTRVEHKDYKVLERRLQDLREGKPGPRDLAYY